MQRMNEQTASILIVEGQNLNAKDLERPLANLGYRIAGVVDSGRKAVQAAEQMRPDLALMDAHLTGSMDSFTAAGEIRNRFRIPIVFLVSNSEGDTAQGHDGIAPYSYVAKPFQSTELNAGILLALNQHRQPQKIFTEPAWLSALLHSLHDAVVATDVEGRATFLNPSAQALTGWSPGEVLGRHFEQICKLRTLEGEDLEGSQIRRALQVKEATPRERFLLTSQTGSTVPIEQSTAPIVEHGALLGAVTVFRPISEELSREEDVATQRDRAQAQVHVTAEALGQTRSDLHSLSKHLINSYEEERRRLAKTFHDDFSQRAALLGLQLDALLESLGENGEATQRLQAMRSQLDSLSEGLRRTSHNLHPSVLSDLGFLPALKGLVLDFRMSGVDVTLRVKGAMPGEVCAEKAIALYRIAEEAIGNIAKHTTANSAPIQLAVSVKGGVLSMAIEGAGSAFDPEAGTAQGGVWLLSMQERARIAGGSLFLGTVKGQGTQVIVRAPLF